MFILWCGFTGRDGHVPFADIDVFDDDITGHAGDGAVEGAV